MKKILFTIIFILFAGNQSSAEIGDITIGTPESPASHGANYAHIKDALTEIYQSVEDMENSLGTAALLDVGNSAGNVVQVEDDGDGNSVINFGTVVDMPTYSNTGECDEASERNFVAFDSAKTLLCKGVYGWINLQDGGAAWVNEE
jgi:hypothetical protein